MTLQENKAILASVFAETAKGNGRAYIETLADDVPRATTRQNEGLLPCP